MEGLRVKIKREYVFNNEHVAPYRCKVTVYLPTEDRDNVKEKGLKAEVKDFNTRLLGERLNWDWGFLNDNKKWRFRTETVASSKDWDALRVKVIELENEIFQKLKEVKKKNEEAIAKKPKDEEVMVIL